ncbi:uncharacterized protein J4E84_004594 [Alternaria hordeiaustralica]|uniref:uncharacterized protein n=1 Tax=Alternaria hordeiaustralica TaxID=1187925 RepID=UPI0020C547C2|nr:uncharacterized protein J4E84_004594 [Alternaria hordeiaustralica]KAI4688664.1 hypothetical protein J4E84_004594 [Alternaria hordeiaustralica]
MGDTTQFFVGKRGVQKAGSVDKVMATTGDTPGKAEMVSKDLKLKLLRKLIEAIEFDISVGRGSGED